MTTKITKTAQNEVTLTAKDPITDCPICWVFSIPTSGGFVRKGDRQVCKGLGVYGSTLSANDGDDLLRLIRSEWKAYRKWALVA